MIPIQRTCDVENIGDFSRYYQSSWVGWHPSDAAHIQPCFVGGQVNPEIVRLRPLCKGEGDAFFLDKDYLVTWSEIKDHLDFGVPDIGMMPDGPTILFCSYTSPRQPRKGYRSRDSRIADFNAWEIRRKYVTKSGGERYDWTWFAFNPEYQTLEQAEDKLASGEKVGVPISRTLGVYSLPKFKHALLAYKRWTVGHIVTPSLIQLKPEYGDYEEDIARQIGAEVIVG